MNTDTERVFTPEAIASEIRYRLVCRTTIYWRDVQVVITTPQPPSFNLEFLYCGRSALLLENTAGLQRRDLSEYERLLECVVQDIINLLELPRQS